MINKFIRRLFGGAQAAPSNTSPLVLGSKQHAINPSLLSSNAVRVTNTLQQAGFKAFVVGGAVRDLLLGIKPKDFDVATNATPEEVKDNDVPDLPRVSLKYAAKGFADLRGLINALNEF